VGKWQRMKILFYTNLAGKMTWVIKQSITNVRKPLNFSVKLKKFGKLSAKQIPKYRGVGKFVIY
jgi:hypothetical protein